MPVDPNISLGVQQFKPMQTIGNMVNIANSALALKKGTETLPYDIAQRKAESELAQQTLAPQVTQQEEAAKRSRLATAADQFRLTGDYVQKARDIGTSMLGDPSVQKGDINGINDLLDKAQAQMIESGIPKDVAAVNVAHARVAAVQNPAGFRDYLANLTQAGTGAGGIAAANVIPAGSQQTLTTDNQGNLIQANKDRMGNIQPIGTAPVVGGGAQMPPRIIPPNETAQSFQALIDRRQAVSDAAAKVPDQHYNNQQIKAILDSGSGLSATGSNAGVIAKIGGMIGMPLGADEATNINTINHYLALQTVNAEQAMGVHTDAGQAVAGAAAGSVTQDPKSLRTTVNINDATSTGLDYFNRGKEKAIEVGGLPAQRDFQNTWSRYYNPYAMRLLNAGKNGDKEEVASVTQELGGVKSMRFQKMLQDARALDKLSTQGHL